MHLVVTDKTGRGPPARKVNRHSHLYRCPHSSTVLLLHHCSTTALIDLSKYHPIRAFYLSATLTYSRMQLPQSYEHLPTAALLCSTAPSVIPSRFPHFSTIQPPIVRPPASYGNTAALPTVAIQDRRARRRSIPCLPFCHTTRKGSANGAQGASRLKMNSTGHPLRSPDPAPSRNLIQRKLTIDLASHTPET